LIAEHGLASEDRAKIAHGILQANVQALSVIRGRVLGREPPISFDPPAAAPAPPPPSTPCGPPLSQELPAFLEWVETAKPVRGQTLAQNETTYRMFLEVCGDKPITDYTRRDTGAFYALLPKLPAQYAKDKRWRGRPLVEIATEGAETLRLTRKTVKRHFSALGTLFDWANQTGRYEGQNPAHGFTFPRDRRLGGGRGFWNQADLKKLFA
jgi:hypothetical protein